MYRRTARYDKSRLQAREKFAKMRAAKEARRLASPPPDYPDELPDVRMIITVERFDVGDVPVVNVMELRKSSRIDCYDAFANGVLWKERIGLSRVLEWIRKANPRLISARALL